LVGVNQVVSLDTPTSISSKPFATIIAGIEVRIGHPDRPILLWADLPPRSGRRRDVGLAESGFGPARTEKET